MKYKGVNHIAMATGDMDMTVRYWRDLLGMRLVAGHGGPGRRQYFFQISDYDLIAFFEWPGVERVRNKRHGEPVTGPFVFDHFSIGVESDDELWEVADRLIAAGFPCSNMMDHGFIHSIYTFDPNGIPLEFSAYVKDVDLIAGPMIADEGRGKAASEGSEPVSGVWPPVDTPFTEDEMVIMPGEGCETFCPKR
ncbi:MAG TPA: VOC family protein [Nitrospirota bacterium]|nr:VOC family protein [Nitrospirota bacterium]